MNLLGMKCRNQNVAGTNDLGEQIMELKDLGVTYGCIIFYVGGISEFDMSWGREFRVRYVFGAKFQSSVFPGGEISES